MTKTHSTPTAYTRKETKAKPEKPVASFLHPDSPYPLTVHPAGYFSTKIRGKVHYFARWDEGAEEAEKRCQAQRDDLDAGRTPRGSDGEQAVMA